MWDYILVAAIVVSVVLAVRSIIKQKKNGKLLSCGGDCSNCPSGKSVCSTLGETSSKKH